MARSLRLISSSVALSLVLFTWVGCSSDGGGVTPTVSDSSNLPDKPMGRGPAGGEAGAGATMSEPVGGN
jgi:hypothetical protein